MPQSESMALTKPAQQLSANRPAPFGMSEAVREEHTPYHRENQGESPQLARPSMSDTPAFGKWLVRATYDSLYSCVKLQP
jgi:hypothetical protein